MAAAVKAEAYWRVEKSAEAPLLFRAEMKNERAGSEVALANLLAMLLPFLYNLVLSSPAVGSMLDTKNPLLFPAKNDVKVKAL